MAAAVARYPPLGVGVGNVRLRAVAAPEELFCMRRYSPPGELLAN